MRLSRPAIFQVQSSDISAPGKLPRIRVGLPSTKGRPTQRSASRREAELCYRQSLDDRAIPAERRASALYDLGIALIHEAGTTDIRRLRDAIGCLEMSRESAADPGLIRDATHNLEVAKALWAKAREPLAKKPSPNNEDMSTDEEPPPPEPKQPGGDQGPKKENKQNGTGTPKPGEQMLPGQEDKDAKPQHTDRKARGRPSEGTRGHDGGSAHVGRGHSDPSSEGK